MASLAELAEMAHLLKRATFNVTAERVEEMAEKGWEAAVRELIDNAPPPQLSTSPEFKNIYSDSDYDDFIALVTFEMKRLAALADEDIGNRMLWFWHNVLTSDTKAPAALLWRQHQLLARHALGNFRAMLREITIDPAMLIYLDGWGSYGASPNQNYARELMELFTLGRGNYSQRDVEAGARALSGWTLDGGGFPPEREGQRFNPDEIHPVFNREAGWSEPVTFLGVTRVHNVDSVIDTILGKPACARFIAKKMFQYFAHSSPSEATVNSLAAVFRNSNYEIKPLVSALIRHPEFRSPQARGARVRFPMETLLAAAAVFSNEIEGFEPLSYFDATGFLPFAPPNVAGWPLGARWLSASQTGARTRMSLVAFDLPKSGPVKKISRADDPVAETLRRASLYEVSPQTYAALQRFARSEDNAKNRARGLLALAVTSPEFALS